jgi:hypothetical protein
MGIPGLGIPGMGGGGGGRRGGGQQRRPQETTTAIVRWDSALPLRLAFAQQDPSLRARPADAPAGGWKKDDDATAKDQQAPKPLDPNVTPKDYILAVDGLPLNSSSKRYSHRDQDDQSSGNGQDDKSASQDRKSDYSFGRDPDAIREELMERTTLSRKEGRTLRPTSVDLEVPGKPGVIYFHFSREDAIKIGDKVMTFQTALGGNKLERKFELKEMVYKGNLEL